MIKNEEIKSRGKPQFKLEDGQGNEHKNQPHKSNIKTIGWTK